MLFFFRNQKKSQAMGRKRTPNPANVRKYMTEKKSCSSIIRNMRIIKINYKENIIKDECSLSSSLNFGVFF